MESTPICYCCHYSTPARSLVASPILLHFFLFISIHITDRDFRKTITCGHHAPALSLHAIMDKSEKLKKFAFSQAGIFIIYLLTLLIICTLALAFESWFYQTRHRRRDEETPSIELPANRDPEKTPIARAATPTTQSTPSQAPDPPASAPDALPRHYSEDTLSRDARSNLHSSRGTIHTDSDGLHYRTQ